MIVLVLYYWLCYIVIVLCNNDVILIIGCIPFITMTTISTECQSPTNELTVGLSISLVLLVIAGIIIIILVLVVIRQYNKMKLLRYIYH